MKKFKIRINNRILSNIKRKLATYNWENVPNIDGWDLGCNKKVLKEICIYWLKKYNQMH